MWVRAYYSSHRIVTLMRCTEVYKGYATARVSEYEKNEHEMDDDGDEQMNNNEDDEIVLHIRRTTNDERN